MGQASTAGRGCVNDRRANAKKASIDFVYAKRGRHKRAMMIALVYT